MPGPEALTVIPDSTLSFYYFEEFCLLRLDKLTREVRKPWNVFVVTVKSFKFIILGGGGQTWGALNPLAGQ